MSVELASCVIATNEQDLNEGVCRRPRLYDGALAVYRPADNAPNGGLASSPTINKHVCKKARASSAGILNTLKMLLPDS